MTDVQPFFSGEVQLAGWNESHTSGAKLVFWLSDPAELEVFRAATIRKNNLAGQRFAMVLVEIGDDERPVNPPERAPSVASDKPGTPKGGALSRLAGLWCKTPQFQQWAFEQFPQALEQAHEGIEEGDDDEIAAEIVRIVCDVDSRARLDHDARAGQRFTELIRHPFMQHCG